MSMSTPSTEFTACEAAKKTDLVGTLTKGERVDLSRTCWPLSLAVCGCDFVDEAHYAVGHFVEVIFQNEVAAIQQHKLRMWQVSQVCAGALHAENLVVLAPHDKGGELVLPERGLEAGIERQVVAVVVEEVELDLVVPRLLQEERVVDPAVRRDLPHVLDARHVLPPRRL